MNLITTLAGVALFLGITVAIASLVIAASRSLGGVVNRRRLAAQSLAPRQEPHRAAARPHRVIRQRRRHGVMARRARRYW